MWGHIKNYAETLGKWGWGLVAQGIFGGGQVYLAITGSQWDVIPMWGWLTMLITGLVIAPFVAFYKVNKKLMEIKLARPHLVFKHITHISPPDYGEPIYTRVYFANNPRSELEGVVAQKVVAHLHFCDKNKQKCLHIIGRWSDTEEIPDGGTTNQIDFEPNGLPRILGIIFKYTDKDVRCLWGDESPIRLTNASNLRDEGRELPPGTFYIKVNLKGRNTAKVFWFKLANNGKGQRVKLSYEEG